MQNKTHDVIAKILGDIGKILVIIGMACGCFLVWYLIISNLIK